MALLHDSVKFKKLDVRLVERNISRGVLTQDEYNEAVVAMLDDAENAEWVSLDSLDYDPDEAEVINGKAPLQHH
jgi:hypothetical protein